MDSLELCRKYKKTEFDYRVSNLEKLDGLVGINDEVICIGMTSELCKLLKRVETGLKSKIDNSYRENIILDSHSSATIEGCRTTVESVIRCMRGKSPSRDDLMVLNIIKAQKLYKDREINSSRDITKIWKVISSGVCENLDCQGSIFRKKMVYVGGSSRVVHTPEKPNKIAGKIGLLVNFINNKSISNILKGIILHYYIEYIHPMCDGNGRLGRVLENIVIGKRYINVYKIPLASVINDNLSGYYKSLRDSKEVCNIKGMRCLDVSPFVEYMLICILEALGRSRVSLDENEKKLISIMKRRGYGSEITVRRASCLLEMKENHTRSLLNKLVGYGFLSKVRVGNRNIYRLERYGE